GGAEQLPVDDDGVDGCMAGLVLNFAPDPAAALLEMRRVTRRGGTVAVVVWDYADGMQLLRRFWDAAVAVDPSAAGLDEGRRFARFTADALATAFDAAGLRRVETRALDVPARFTDFDDLWEPFRGGVGPAPAYCASLDDDHRAALRERLRDSVPTASDGSISLTCRAWAVRGVV
ncbi:MAG: methyltransferase domain-containing protein, partial [Solirubrobacteraceae bacterium]|nr:methyltransferase domain-containing protein [Patulibacter sp.]